MSPERCNQIKRAAILAAVLDAQRAGKSAREAYDAVFGAGAYDRLAGAVYDELRRRQGAPTE